MLFPLLFILYSSLPAYALKNPYKIRLCVAHPYRIISSFDVTAFPSICESTLRCEIQFGVEDPGQVADDVNVTGPKIAGSFDLIYGGAGPGSWYGGHDFGTDLPDTPATYKVHIFKDGIDHIQDVVVQSFNLAYASNLSPIGAASGDITFSWTGVNIPNVLYYVQFNGWNSEKTTDDYISYTGDPLTPGEEYWYCIAVEDAHGSENLACEQFVYESSPQIEVGGFSRCNSSGQCHVQLFAGDENHLADSISVTGPGVDGSLSLTYEATGPGLWWSIPSIEFGSPPPTPPLTYIFQITIDGIDHTREKIIESFLFEVATNLSPAGAASGDITFTWTGINVPGILYQVALADETGSDIWYSLHSTDTFAVYTGPALSPGSRYHYIVLSEDIYGNGSHAIEEFVYEPLPVYDVITQHFYPDSYDLGMGFDDSVASVTVSGPDISHINNHPDSISVTLSQRPAIGSEYEFTIHFTDGASFVQLFTVENINDSFVWMVSPADNETITTTTPAFVWQDVAGAENTHIVVSDSSGIIWWSPDFPSGTTSCVYNFDGTAAADLQFGYDYGIQINSYDQYGDQTITWSQFSVRAINPQVSSTSGSRSVPDTLSQPGWGFTPGGIAELHFRRPDDSLSPTTTEQVRLDGTYDHNWEITPDAQTGFYQYWAKDLSTGKESLEVDYEIRP